MFRLIKYFFLCICIWGCLSPWIPLFAALLSAHCCCGFFPFFLYLFIITFVALWAWLSSGLRDSDICGNVRRPTGGDWRPATGDCCKSQTIRWIHGIRHRKPAPDHNLSVARPLPAPVLNFWLCYLFILPCSLMFNVIACRWRCHCLKTEKKGIRR